MPVIEDHRLVGTISEADLVRHLSEDQVGTSSRVSAPPTEALCRQQWVWGPADRLLTCYARRPAGGPPEPSIGGDRDGACDPTQGTRGSPR
ncbi:hypothetical protein [Streptomyces sp. NBC_01264]|uniref:hypothetical protein n=1 Tax=Streptomyces sp. NBC_01264 TaxID=2903804 RepID=UPI002257CF99|nr:hypothetical protein [Streptomyces sp. NBC_01264]MCX4781586.1 hypothetical protein [Streptomyces sp. NBC_01264]